MPTFVRLFRWCFSWRMLRRGLIGLAALLTLIALCYAVVNWRGQRAWAAYKTKLDARGIRLHLKAFIPPPVPDDQNFAMTPFLAPLFDFNPTPLKPGESRWRDTNGFKRVSEFATVVGSGPSEGRQGWRAGQKTELAEWLRHLQHEKNKSATPTNAQPAGVDDKAVAAAVMEAFQEFRPVLEELREASHRPHARFNVRYDEENPWAILLPHLAVVNRTSRVLEVRAAAELALGKTEAACEDVNFILYLADSVKEEPFLISYLLRVAVMDQALQAVWEGLAGRQWTEAQLQDFQARLRDLTLIRDLEQPMGAERAAGDETIAHLRERPDGARLFTELGGGNNFVDALLFHLAPRGWIYQEQVSYHQIYDQFILPGYDPAAGMIHPAIIEASAKSFEKLFGDTAANCWEHRLMARLLLPAVSRCYQKSARAQTGVNEAILACALERHRLANGRVPDSLEALVPRFLPKLPPDVLTGEPLKYRRLDDGQFLIYSVGWNEKDDGGVVVSTGKNKVLDAAQGDWVWQYPGK
ncbi:MAG: hypothetical protein JWR69_356 [Pedosphaera sp.]|nr:hypothetical protein [Pedosphaera sp.]